MLLTSVEPPLDQNVADDKLLRLLLHTQMRCDAGTMFRIPDSDSCSIQTCAHQLRTEAPASKLGQQSLLNPHPIIAQYMAPRLNKCNMLCIHARKCIAADPHFPFLCLHSKLYAV